MAKTFYGTFTDAQKDHYEELAYHTGRGLREAIRKLKKKKARSTTSRAEAIELNKRLGDLTYEKTRFRALDQAIRASQQTMKAPTKSQWQKAEQMAQDIEALTSNAKLASAAVDLVSDLLTIWKDATS